MHDSALFQRPLMNLAMRWWLGGLVVCLLPVVHASQGDDPQGYYKVLDITKDADQAAITKAYRKQMLVGYLAQAIQRVMRIRMMPTFVDIPATKSSFQWDTIQQDAIQQAYYVLSDANLKHTYDTSGTLVVGPTPSMKVPDFDDLADAYPNLTIGDWTFATDQKGRRLTYTAHKQPGPNFSVVDTGVHYMEKDGKVMLTISLTSRQKLFKKRGLEHKQTQRGVTLSKAGFRVRVCWNGDVTASFQVHTMKRSGKSPFRLRCNFYDSQDVGTRTKLAEKLSDEMLVEQKEGLYSSQDKVLWKIDTALVRKVQDVDVELVVDPPIVKDRRGNEYIYLVACVLVIGCIGYCMYQGDAEEDASAERQGRGRSVKQRTAGRGERRTRTKAVAGENAVAGVEGFTK